MATLESRVKTLENGRKGRLTVVVVLDGDIAPVEAYKAHHGKNPDRVVTISIVEGVIDPLPLPSRDIRR